MQGNNGIDNLIVDAEKRCHAVFEAIDGIALYNQEKLLRAFQKSRISSNHFSGSSGYGYDDLGREKLSEVFAEIFVAEAAVVSPLIVSGTHAINLAFSSVLRPGDTMLSVTGKPYDTLYEAILGDNNGSLKDYGINYKEIPLSDGDFDMAAVAEYLKNAKPKVVFIQRSGGYTGREAFSVGKIAEAITEIRKNAPNACVVVDNCYGEFAEKSEPCEAGADLVAGSLIKNPGGGLAPTGGYIAGKSEYVRQVEYRLTAPGIGCETGSYQSGYRLFFQGLFLAPHTVAQAMKGSALCGAALEAAGFRTFPSIEKAPSDIIRAVEFDTEEQLVAFCRQIQYESPIDSFATCEPWDMPGYRHQVIMAAGTFVQGSSIELSCDAPIKKPYIAYLQGGLTYEHIKIALKKSLNVLINS